MSSVKAGFSIFWAVSEDPVPGFPQFSTSLSTSRHRARMPELPGHGGVAGPSDSFQGLADRRETQ
ncbi:MAG: hypothetical protein OXC26_09190, partial [Albidovulum sp.]|nr:hypothetical protein [Albidovulum sp.]